MPTSPRNYDADTLAFLSLKTRVELAIWLGVDDRRLRFLLYAQSTNQRYKTFSIRKRNGQERQISAPSPALKDLQRKILAVLTKLYSPRPVAKGFIPGRSIADHARAHRGKRIVLVFDIQEFFPSINFGRVLGIFQARPFSLPPEVAIPLAQLCTDGKCLPQGASTSPMISNFVCRSLDRDLQRFAARNRLTITRYADDICISTNLREMPSEAFESTVETKKLGAELSEIFLSAGFSINPSKTRLRSGREKKLVTGLVVNEGISMPRFWRRQLRVMLHLASKRKRDDLAALFNDWKFERNRVAPISDGGQVIRGKAGFARWLDRVSGADERRSSFFRSIHRQYPKARDLLPIPGHKVRARVVAEGISDQGHLRAALRYYQQQGKFRALELEFLNFSGDNGDQEVLATIRRLVKANVPQLTIGLFDSDNEKFLKEIGLSAGKFLSYSDYVYVAVLGSPEPDIDHFCIENLYLVEEITRQDSQGRRIFFADEFDEKGEHKSGLFQTNKPKKGAIVVSDRVTRKSDGASVNLGKAALAKYIEQQVHPFELLDFSRFIPTFELLEYMCRHHEDRLGR